jgi:hypothetical protein
VAKLVDLLAHATLLVCQKRCPDYEVPKNLQRPSTEWGEAGNDGLPKIGGSTRKCLGGNRI